MITTSPNRVKHGVYWCEEADTIVAKSLEGTEYTPDSEIPFDWIIEHNTLADTLLSLGAVRPKYQKKANDILINFVRRLYMETLKCLNECDITHDAPISVPHWICNPDRIQACRLEYRYWQTLKRTRVDPHESKLCEAMVLFFSEQPAVLKATHGTKLYLGAYAIKHGFKEADIIRQELKQYLKLQLEKPND